jgi:hypothetical protein
MIDLLGLLTICDDMTENKKNDFIEFTYRCDNQKIVGLGIYSNKRKAVVSLACNALVLSYFEFVDCESIRVLDSEKKCMEIIAIFNGSQNKVRCFLALKDKLIVDVDTSAVQTS